MNLAQFIKYYLITLPIFVTIDALWLLVLAKKLYQKEIGHLFGPTNFTAIIVFYLLFTVGITFFVLLPGLEKESVIQLLLHSALFGAITYATYDLTNLATIKNWPINVTIIDILWGAVLVTITSLISFTIITKLP